MSKPDILERLGNHAAVTMFDVDEAAKEIKELRCLRLTDAEREALVRNLRHGKGMWLMHVSQGDKAVIDALLERHAK